MACDVHARDEGVEVSSGEVVGVVPVDHATGPFNSALGLAGDAGGPETTRGNVRSRGGVKVRRGHIPELDTGRGAGVVAHAVGADCIGGLELTNDISINEPCEDVGLPVDL